MNCYTKSLPSAVRHRISVEKKQKPPSAGRHVIPVNEGFMIAIIKIVNNRYCVPDGTWCTNNCFSTDISCLTALESNLLYDQLSDNAHADYYQLVS